MSCQRKIKCWSVAIVGLPLAIAFTGLTVSATAEATCSGETCPDCAFGWNTTESGGNFNCNTSANLGLGVACSSYEADESCTGCTGPDNDCASGSECESMHVNNDAGLVCCVNANESGPGQTCSAAGDCCTNVCRNGICAGVANGGFCTADAQCSSGACFDAGCVAPGNAGARCDDGSGCAGTTGFAGALPLLCEEDGGPSSPHSCCIPSGSAAQECTANSQCCGTSSGDAVECHDGLCCNWAGGSCSTQNDCCSGNYCDNGSCAINDGDGYCTAGSQCTSDVCTTSGVYSNTCACEPNGTDVGGDWWECCSLNCTGNDCSTNPSLGSACSPAGGLPQGSCTSFTQECDPDGGTGLNHDGGVCLISGQFVGSAYEPCTSTSQCATWPDPLECTYGGWNTSIYQCCNGYGGRCQSDAECCTGDPGGASCTSQTLGIVGTCRGITGAYSLDEASNCLFGLNPSDNSYCN